MDSPPGIAQSLQHHMSGHFVRLKPVRTLRPEPMDYLLIWIARGRFFATVGDETLEAGPGDLVLFEPGVPQDYQSEDTDAWEWLWVHFGGGVAPEFARAIRGGDAAVVRHLGFDDSIRSRFAELLSAAPPYSRDEWRSNLHADTCLYSLLGLMVHRLEQTSAAPREASRLDAAALQAFLHEHLTDDLAIDDLAARHNLSPSHFARSFKALFGTSPMRYVIELRVGRAATLLTTTDHKLSDIAAAVGYDDPYYFSRIFKKVTGVAPSAYRHQRKAPNSLALRKGQARAKS